MIEFRGALAGELLSTAGQRFDGRDLMSDVRLAKTTCADVLAAPPSLEAELFDGVPDTMPRPRPWLAKASSCLGIVMSDPFDLGNNGPGGWQILDEPELQLGGDVAVPDVAGWRLERIPELPLTVWFGLTQRCWIWLSRIRDRHHHLAEIVMIGGDELLPIGVDPVVCQRAILKGPAWMREPDDAACGQPTVI